MGEKEEIPTMSGSWAGFWGAKMTVPHFWECIRCKEAKCCIGEGWMLVTTLMRDDNDIVKIIWLCGTYFGIKSQEGFHFLFFNSKCLASVIVLMPSID